MKPHLLTRMITGDGALFAEESQVVGRHGGWTAPESVSRDQSTGFESVDAYFDSDQDDSGETSTLHLMTPSLRNIRLSASTPLQRIPQPVFKEPPRVSSPLLSPVGSPARPAGSPVETFVRPPLPLPIRTVQSEVANEVANPKPNRPPPRLQDDGYNGMYDASQYDGDDFDYSPEENNNGPELDDLDEIDMVASLSEPQVSLPLVVPQTSTSRPISTPARQRSPQPDPRLESLEPVEPTQPLETLEFKRRRIRRYQDNEGSRPPMRFDVPVQDLDSPSYAEIVDTTGIDIEQIESEDEGSVASMIVNDDPLPTGDYIDINGISDSGDSDTSENPSVTSDSEIEEIELPAQIPQSPHRNGPRRSTRTKISKLDTWRGEYIVYKYDPVTGTRTATLAHTVEPDVDPVAQPKKPRRRQPITVLESSSKPASSDGGPAPLFNESIRDYQQQILAKSLNPADTDDAKQVPFPESPNVLINTILEGQRGMPVVIAQLMFGRGAAIPPRNSGELWYTFICWTGKLQFTVHDKAVVIQREGAVTIPAGNDFFIENLSVGTARVLMVQATCQDIAEEYSRMDASHLSNFDDIPSSRPPTAGHGATTVGPSNTILDD